MRILELPIMPILEKSETVLLAGAGGGYDIFCGLPLYFALKKAGKTVYLANLSFSLIYASSGKRIGPAVVEIDSSITGYLPYFPELHLAKWLKSQHEPDTIYCIDRTGAKPTTQAYQFLKDRLNPDTVILIDGGTDSLMRGDEPMLGTPQEDIVSIAGVNALTDVQKLLICIGFGIDTYHGVCHAYMLEAVADLIKQNGFYGAWTLTKEMEEVKLYKKASEFVFREMRNHPSIVSSSIISAINGRFGNHHATLRTEGSELFINPLMSLYWCFDVDAVARRNLYIDKIRETETYTDLNLAIETYRAIHQNEERPWINLPM